MAINTSYNHSTFFMLDRVSLCKNTGLVVPFIYVLNCDNFRKNYIKYPKYNLMILKATQTVRYKYGFEFRMKACYYKLILNHKLDVYSFGNELFSQLTKMPMFRIIYTKYV